MSGTKDFAIIAGQSLDANALPISNDKKLRKFSSLSF
jgi:hypothetical protein